MKIKQAHTPTPEEIKDVIDHSYLNAHTAYIVRAVNAHNRLIEELEITRCWLRDMAVKHKEIAMECHARADVIWTNIAQAEGRE